MAILARSLKASGLIVSNKDIDLWQLSNHSKAFVRP